MTNQHTRDEHDEGLISAVRVIYLGLCMDAIYQWIVLRTFYPAETVIIAIALAYFAHLRLRGPITRVARWNAIAPGSAIPLPIVPAAFWPSPWKKWRPSSTGSKQLP